jgi:hypothetical protein
MRATPHSTTGRSSSGAQPLVLCLQAHQLAQLVAAAREARAHRADGYFEDRGHFLVRHAFEPDEKDYFALLRLQLAKRGFEVTQLQGRHYIRLNRQLRGFAELDAAGFAHRAPDIVDMLIVQDREEPGAQIGAGLPQMLFGDRAGEATLDEIVGPRHIPRQRPRIAAQPGNFRFEQPSVVGH